jgi:peptidoglycan-associated lipoprotein
MSLPRRDFLKQITAAGLTTGLLAGRHATADDQSVEIIDTHQHLWDLDKFRLPWLKDAEEVLRQSYRTEEYRAATPGLKIRAIYMEVDVDPKQHVAEAEHVLQLCKSGEHPTVAAVIGGRPASDGFADYIGRFKDNSLVKGVRQVLHGESTPAGYCLQDSFVKGVRLLGEVGKRFDLCMRPGELADGAKLAEILRKLGAGDTGPLHDIHFDYDSFDLDESARQTLQEDADWLKDHPEARVEIEGHCDNRGTVEYNLALGAKRAAAAKSYLIALGIGRDRLTTISYGEELPLCQEETESCWSRNRRAHLVVVGN